MLKDRRKKKKQLQRCADVWFQGHNVDCKDGRGDGVREEGRRGGVFIAGGVGEQEASWLLLSTLSLYVNTTH